MGQRLLHRDALAHRQEAVLQVVQKAGPLGVDEGDVPVGAGEVPAFLQPGDVPLQHGPGDLPLFLGKAVQMLLQKTRQLLGGVEEFPGGGDGDPGEVLLPALGLGGEGGDGVDLVPPELQPHRLGAVGGPEVQDAAPDGELAHPLHLAAPGVPRPKEGPDQLILFDLLSRQQGDGAFPEDRRGDGGLHRRPRRSHGDRPGLRRHPAEDRKAQLLILPADPLHLPQGQLPLGVVPGQGLPQKEVQLLAEADGGLFVLGDDQGPLVPLPAEGGQQLGLVDLGDPGDQHGAPAAPQAGADPFDLLPGGDKLFHHCSRPPAGAGPFALGGPLRLYWLMASSSFPWTNSSQMAGMS